MALVDGIADEGEGVGFFGPDEMLILGFAGDEFVRGCRVSAGGGDDEDAVGFGFVCGDGVGEGFSVAGDLVVEDVGEIARGLCDEIEEGQSGAELGSFAGTCRRGGCGFWFCGVFFCSCGWWRRWIFQVGYEAVGFFGELEAFDVGDASGFGGGEVEDDEFFVRGVAFVGFGFFDGGVGGVGEEDEGFGVVGEGELDGARGWWAFSVGVFGWWWRELAGAFDGFLCQWRGCGR